MSEEKNRTMPNDILDDAELDALMAQWAEAEVELPEGFHENLMTRLRTEQAEQLEQAEQIPQQKTVIVSLAERFASKKPWISAALAAALVLCCLPVLHNQQDMLADVNNSAAQTYEMKSRTVDTSDNTGNADGSGDSVTMTSMLADTEQAAAPVYNNVNSAVEKNAVPAGTSFDYAISESGTQLTPAERVEQIHEEIAALENQLTALTEQEATQRSALETEIAVLQEELKQLEAQIAAENSNQ